MKITDISNEEAAVWTMYLLQLYADEINQEQLTIGGKNVAVEIYMTKSGKKSTTEVTENNEIGL